MGNAYTVQVISDLARQVIVACKDRGMCLARQVVVTCKDGMLSLGRMFVLACHNSLDRLLGECL